MAEVEDVCAEIWEGRRRCIFSEAVWDYVVCALVLECYVVCLVEPPDVMMLDKYMAGFTSDGRSFS